MQLNVAFQIATYPLLGGVVRDNVRLIEKRVVDFLLMLIEPFFSLVVTADTQRAKIDRKSAMSLQRVQFDQKFQVEGGAPPPQQLFLHG